MSSISQTIVAILAGGKGTRLAPVLSGQQKVVTKVRGYPFLEYLLNQLNKYQIKNVVLCTGYLSHQVKDQFGKKFKGISLSYSYEEFPLGTAGAVANALDLLKTESVLVMNGDSFCDVDLESFYNFHLKKQAKCSLVLTNVDKTERFGQVDINANDEVVSFKEKQNNASAGYINGGIYLIEKSLLEEIPKGKAVSFEIDLFPNWVSRGLYGFQTDCKFIDIGTPESYKEAKNFF